MEHVNKKTQQNVHAISTLNIIVANSTCSIKWVTSVFEFIHCLFDWAVMCEEAAELTSMTSRIVLQNKIKKRKKNKKNRNEETTECFASLCFV